MTADIKISDVAFYVTVIVNVTRIAARTTSCDTTSKCAKDSYRPIYSFPPWSMKKRSVK